VLAVALFSLEPTMLAHGRVVQTDVPAAFGFLFVCFALHRYLMERSWRRSLVLGLACGVALLSKFSTLIIAPLLLIIFAMLLWRINETGERKALTLHAALVIVVTVLVIQAAYFFQSRSLVPSDVFWINWAFPANSNLVEKSVRTLSYILPTDFVIGAFWQLWHSNQGHPAGLLGMYRQNGWWYYFPVAFSLKTSLPFLMISISAISWATYEVVRRRTRSVLILLIPFACYTLLVVMSPINIGVRYYLPAYTFLFMLGGTLLDRLLRVTKPRFLGTVVVAILLAWSAIEMFRSYPNYMTYMNQLAMSHPKWWYLSDSNVEWGDDIKELADYLHARGETRIQSAVLGGFLILPFYDIENFELLAPVDEAQFPRTRYVAIGASCLNGSTIPGRAIDGTDQSNEKRVNRFAGYRNRVPEAVFGDSIYLYRLQD
jgi:Dolichyl-phosphate-mannose-protein mannosyltransferase